MRRDLAETTDILHGNMNKMLERGDKVENLIRKSETLKSSARMFKRIVKKRAPTPPRGMSEKVKYSTLLSLGTIILAALAFGTNHMMTATVYPQLPNATAEQLRYDAILHPDQIYLSSRT